MIAIRIENISDGVGLFRHKNACGKETSDNGFNRLITRHKKFPVPFMDNYTDNYNIRKNVDDFFEHVCAFKSVKDLSKWVTKCELIRLKKLNFRVYEFELNECHVGEYQILFKKKNIISKKDITYTLISIN